MTKKEKTHKDKWIKLVYDKLLSQAIEEYSEMKEVYYSIHQDMMEEKETILMLFRRSKRLSLR